MDQSVTLKIDGQDISVPPGTTVLDAAKRAGIEIPSLCNHEKLLPAGLCRLCLIEIEKMRGLQAACATVVRDGMAVHTDTPAVQHNRRMVLELLCTNHPLDCPVCDAGGDCHLQDYVFRYGRTASRFVEEKRHKGKAIDLGPAVVLDQERCVLCQRCVRFCEEVLDDRQLAVFQRGASSRIGTLPGRVFDSIFSGNVVDLCPVGAMTDRVFRFKARTWELRSVPSVCPLCPVGCRVTVDARNERLLRLRGREAPEVNNGWLCDLGRTGYGFVDSPDRLRQPLVRRSGKLEPATWEQALAAVAAGLRRVRREAGPQAVAGLGSPRLTNEAAYLLGRFMRGGMGTNNVDSRLGTATPPPAQATMADLRRADLIVLYEGDPGEEAPILELWVKEAVRRGGRLVIVHSHALNLSRYAGRSFTPRPGTEGILLAGALAAVARTDGDVVPQAWREALAGLGPTQVASLTGCEREAAEELASALCHAERAIVAYGTGVRDEESVALLGALAKTTGVRLLGWGEGPNARGAADMGLLPDRLPGQARLDDPAARKACEKAWRAAVPGRVGLAGAELWGAVQNGQVRALYVAGVDPLSEVPDPQAVDLALRAVDLLVVQDAFLTRTAQRADVVLPAAAFGEEEGSLTNLAGQVGWQQAAVAPLGQSRPHWRILADLARLLELPGKWDYASAGDVLAEVARLVTPYAGVVAIRGGAVYDARYEYTAEGAAPAAPRPWAQAGPGDLALVTGQALFAHDVLVARAPAALQRAGAPCAWLSPVDAGRLGIADGCAVEVQGQQGKLRVQARICEGISRGTVLIPGRLGSESLSMLGARPGVVAMVAVKPSG